MTAVRCHPFDIVLRVLAERLEGGEASPELREALRSRAGDWEGVVAEASSQYALAAFAAAVRDLGLSEALEPDLREFLAAVYAANVDRNRGLRDQLVELAAVLNRVGIEPVLLKGAIRLVDDLYPEIGWRMMRDLDLLIPKARIADAIGALREAGYASEQRTLEPSERDWRARHPDRPALVELHRELFGLRRQQQVLRSAEVVQASQPAVLDGVKVRLPSLEHQILHLITHGHVYDGGYVYGRIELRDRLEAALLMRSLPADLDWGTILGRFATAGYRRPLLTFLLAMGDGALCAMPRLGRIDRLTSFQVRRTALQARSAPLTRAGWYILQVKKQMSGGNGEWPRAVHTVGKLISEPDERRILISKLVSGPRLQ